MRLPVFKGKDAYQRRIVNFGGINRLQGFSEGEIYDCGGISHNSFPALTQRKKSELEFFCETPVAAIHTGKECVATASSLYYDRKEVGKLSEGEKQIVQMRNKIIVFPDKMYYDTETEKFLSLEGRCEFSDAEVVFTTDRITVTREPYNTSVTYETLTLNEEKDVFKYSDVSVENGVISFSAAEMITAKDLAEGDIFSEISGARYYRIAENVAVENGKAVILNQYVTVERVDNDILKQFSEGDIVEISGCVCAENNRQATVVEAGGDYLLFAEGTFEEGEETGTIIIKRNIPEFSCVGVFKNRLWGCSGNTIYASALGDPANYFKYNNLSTDSFTIESDSPGDFTAVKVYGNYCLFFKQDKCYRLYGDRPANFQLTEAFYGGISAEDSGSIADVSGKIFYKGNGGVFAFYGGIPQKISDKLGETKLSDCTAGGFSDCYYLSADTENGREEFVFDTKHALWSKSGIKNVRGYFSSADSMYRLMDDGIYRITENTDDNCEWFAELCPFDEDYHKTKNYSRIYITARLFEDSVIKAEISRDGGEWQTVCVNYGSKKEYINIPCPVKGCHEMRIRLSGRGKSLIESVIREFSVNRG